MSLPTFRPPRITDPADANQRQVKTAIKQLDQPGVRKTVVTGVKLSTNTAKVAHQLGRVPVAWVILDQDSPAAIWRDPAVTATGDFIPLVASTAVTVSIQFW